MIQILLLPVLPHVAEASLEYLAFGLPKLSALGLFMLHLHRHGDLCRPYLQFFRVGCDSRQWRRGARRKDHNNTSARLSVTYKKVTRTFEKR